MEQKHYNFLRKLLKQDKKKESKGKMTLYKEFMDEKVIRRFSKPSKELDKAILFYRNSQGKTIDNGETTCLACNAKYDGPIQYRMCPDCRSTLRIYFPKLIGRKIEIEEEPSVLNPRDKSFWDDF